MDFSIAYPTSQEIQLNVRLMNSSTDWMSFCKTIPDQPNNPGMDQYSAKSSNSVIDQVRRVYIQSGASVV